MAGARRSLLRRCCIVRPATSGCSAASTCATARASTGARATRSRWRLAATRLFAAGGAGGAGADGVGAAARGHGQARRSPTDDGLPRPHLLRLHGRRGRLRLRPHSGLFAGAAPFAFTFVPAIFGAGRDAVCLALALVPTDLERRLEPLARPQGPRSGGSPSSSPGARGDVGRRARGAQPRARRATGAARRGRCSGPSSIAVLWACVPRLRHGAAARGVIVRPTSSACSATCCRMPGGVGGVDGGMIGAFVAFGVSGGAGRGRGAGLPGVRVLAADDPGRHRLLPAAAHRRALEEERPAAASA